ncbi:hypothetical protein BASA81_016993 [Batrachochytrium salamandrivorans]|nr:hypothetical protein BASA81_016993 [Batrachochytrium salamandrivorans]
MLPDISISMANSDISVPSVDHRQKQSLSTTFSIYGLAAVSITYLRSILAPILGHQMEHVSKIDRRTTKHGARFRITVPEDRQRNIIQRLERQSKQTHWRIRQNYRHRRPDQPRPTAPPPPLSRQILAVNVANISNKRPAIRHIVRNTRLWAISETCITSSKFRFTVPGFDVIQHPATGPGRRGIALGIPSCFGGHEHGSAVGTMILAKVPNFTPECLWIVESVYVGHSGATTNYSRREAFASIRQALDRVVPFDNNHPVLIFGDWNTDPQRLQRIVHLWGHGLTVMQFSGSQITRLSTVHGRRHSSIDHFVCNAPARALLTSPRVDRQTAVADHFVIRTSIRAEAQGQPPVPRAPTISRHHCLEATDRIATSNYWDVLADSAVDIIQRRQNAGLNTHVLFIDIRKAFDTVPVGALLWKLQNMGFPHRTLAFLKALYTSSSARARAGSLLSDPFPVQRGVRQGCPLSGLLFNLFINDILDGVAPITVPGLPRDTNPIRGLMYADDVAVFADSEQSLLAVSTAIEQWANQWEMQFGVAKCGIISFTGHLAPRLDSPLDIRLHGQLVSRVESYKYLGVLIDSKLDHSAWLKQKRFALEHTISALHPVLANHQLTVNYRSRIFSAVVMGKAYYGLELVGGNKSHLAPLQTTINKGIRLFTGARLSTAIGPLLVETGIGSLLTRSLVSRVRLLERSVTKRTPINAICSGTDNDVLTLNVQGQLVRSQRWFWSRRTKQLYRNRYWLTPQARPKTVKQRHSFALMETLRTCGDSASLQKYVTRKLLDTAGFFKDPSFDQSRAHGTRYLMLARMDALWTARKAIQIGILVDTHPFSVDRCILCDQQLLSTSIAHLVVECEQVTGHRIQSGLVPAIQKSRLRLLGRALDPSVENVYTWLRGGVLNGEADLDQRWLDGTVEHESMGTRHDNRALAARLADFLQVAYRQYQSTLWKYHRDRLVEVG